jgi:D-alanine-D-alanine ligase
LREKIRVAIIFGGKSAEHEISIISAKNVIDAINKDKYETIPIGIDKDGSWYLNEQSNFILESSNPKAAKINNIEDKVFLVPSNNANELINISKNKNKGKIDVAFPLLHGTYGEDGSIQGLLRMANIPYVGADVLGSAVGMDKDVLKRLLRDAKIPTPNFVVFDELENTSFNELSEEIGPPMFIKPANLGSSVGISKVNNEEEFKKAIDIAFTYDKKIICEKSITGREIECAVLGNEDPVASIPGEIVVKSEFYSYETKYLDGDAATLKIPAKLTEKTIKKIQECAVKTFKVLCCQGMARVDFFLHGDDEMFVNEINTIPGFTKISMYPKLWEASGIPYMELIDRLIQLALERFNKEQKLKTSFE